MWAIFKTIEYGFGDRLRCLRNWVFPARFINNFSKRKITNYHLDLNEVRHSLLTELLRTLSFCLLEFILFHTGALASFEQRTNLSKIFQHPLPLHLLGRTSSQALGDLSPRLGSLRSGLTEHFPQTRSFLPFHDFTRAVPSAWDSPTPSSSQLTVLAYSSRVVSQALSSSSFRELPPSRLAPTTRQCCARSSH